MKRLARFFLVVGFVGFNLVRIGMAQDTPAAKPDSPVNDKPLRVAVFNGQGSVAVEEIVKTLKEHGMEAETLGSKEFDRLCEFDVIFLGGGWNRFNWIKFDDRVKLVEFVEQRGGGAIFSMFRCGAASRGLVRPVFPEIAYAFSKSNGSDMFVTVPDHPVTRGLPDKFITTYWDLAVMEVGIQGKVLAENSNGDPTLVCGPAGRGRVVFIGPWIGLGRDNKGMYPLADQDEKLLLNSVKWAGGSTQKQLGGKCEPDEEAMVRVWRREKIIDWTHNGANVAWYAGILPRAMFPSQQKLDAMAFRLERIAPYAETSEESLSIVNLRNRIAIALDELNTRYELAVKNKIREIGKMPLDKLQEVPIRDFDGFRRKKTRELTEQQIAEWQEALCPSSLLDAMEEDVAALENGIDLDSRMHKRLEAERKEDLKAIDEYIRMAGSDDTLMRRRGVEELARIGDRRASPALLKALEDKDRKVRLAAVKGLAWMQDSAAVKPLIQIVEKSDDRWMRRRAVQALGQIGQDRAFDTLVRALNDEDVFVRRNAIISLGWLGNPKAVPHLLKIFDGNLQHGSVKDKNGVYRVTEHAYIKGKNLPLTRTDLACAIRALGHLGDKQSLAKVEEFFETERLAEGGRHFPPISQEQLLGEFKAEIEAGGRDVKGLPQPRIFSSKSYCYPLGSRYTGMYGRWECFGGRPRDTRAWADYSVGIGGSAHAAFKTTDQFIERVPDITNNWDYLDRIDYKQYLGFRQTGYTVFDQAGLEHDLLTWGQHPHFAGFWGEEAYFFDGHLRRMIDMDAVFRAYLTEKYSTAELKELGLDDLSVIKCPETDGTQSRHSLYDFDGARRNKVVFAEYAEFLGDHGLEFWQEAAEWIRQTRKGATMTFSLSARFSKGGSTYIDAYAVTGRDVLDCYGPQSYGAHSMMNNFKNDMHADGESRPVMGEYYQHQSGNAGRVERGVASSFVHGQCYFNWWWGHIFKQPPGGNGGCSVWDKGRWGAFSRQYRKGRAISEYIAPRDTMTVGTVAQVYSGRTTTLTYGRGELDSFGGYTSGGRQFRYTQHQEALWEALMQSHLPVDMTWMETQSPDKLKRYKVVLLMDAWSLSDDEAEMLRDWVREGGVLIAGGGTSLHDAWDRPLDDYALADVFGVSHEKTDVRGGMENMNVYIERAVKPSKGITKIELKDPDYARHAGENTTAEYEKSIGCDTIKPTTARVVGVWEDGTPAVTENKFGKGACIFLSPVYPGLSCNTVGWTVDPLHNEYWPGARELIETCVRRGIEIAGAELPVEVENCPLTVEAVLRSQPLHNRLVVHFLDIDPARKQVSGINAGIRLPEGRKVKSVFYPYPSRRELEYTVDDGKLNFHVRDFSVHELVVVELAE